jgi:hypothetical protein
MNGALFFLLLKVHGDDRLATNRRLTEPLKQFHADLSNRLMFLKTV